MEIGHLKNTNESGHVQSGLQLRSEGTWLQGLEVL